MSGGDFALVGPTASGKTALAVALGRRLADVELVSVDAFALYRGLDIGTAKPAASERRGVTWHLLDVAEPDEEFSLGRFRALAGEAARAIAGRGHRAGYVGGTGLYQRAVVDGLSPPARYPGVAARLEAEADRPGGLAALYRRLGELDPQARARIEPANRRRIVRALEVCIGSGRPFSSYGPGLTEYRESPVRQLGLALPRDELDRRIEARLDAQLAKGFLDEVRALRASPRGLSRTARQALGYSELLAHLDGAGDLEAARAAILRRTRRLARRQQSWFGRDPRIVWLDATRPDLVEQAAAIVVGKGGGEVP